MDPHSAHRDLGHKRRYYAERLEAAGFSIEGRDLPMARLLALGDSEAEAEEIARRGAEWIVNSYFGAAHNPVGIKDPTAPGADPVRRYLDGVILYGTVDSMLDRILQLRRRSASTTCSPPRSAIAASCC